jgi:hypothetical protein
MAELNMRASGLIHKQALHPRSVLALSISAIARPVFMTLAAIGM